MTKLPALGSVAPIAIVLAVFSASTAHSTQTRAFVYATDFSSGSLANIQFGPPRTVSTNVAAVSSDAVLRHFDGLLYVVNRLGFDNIKVLDPAQSFATVQEFSVGNGSNPHDIEFLSSNKAYVARYESPDLWIVNPQTGQHTGTISLAAFADADGIPEMDHLALRDGKLFVSIQRLDRNNFFAPTDSSQIVVIDPATDAVVDADPGAGGNQGIILPFQNPTTELVVDPSGELLVGCVGNFGVLDGGIVRIDPVALDLAAVEITESALGGDVNDVAPFTGQRGFAVISDASFTTILKAYRRDLGTVQSTIYSTAGFFLADIEVNDRDELWVCDRTFSNPGVRVFDAVTGTQLAAMPLDVGLPPQDIAFDGTTPVTAVAPPSGDFGFVPAIASIAPNPFRSHTTVHFTLPDAALGENVVFTVVDLAGRVLSSTVLRATAPGVHSFSWDGNDAHGRQAPRGVYFVSVGTSRGRASARIVRLP
jgi:flagellar hook capping protein FlgD